MKNLDAKIFYVSRFSSAGQDHSHAKTQQEEKYENQNQGGVEQGGHGSFYHGFL